MPCSAILSPVDILKHKDFGDTLTSYDLVKSAAIILMIIDHAGQYLYPDMDILRVLGRLCVPLWFFLIGYAHSRDIPKSWVIGAAILALSTPLLDGRFFPLNILVTMMILRLVLDFLAPYFLANTRQFVSFSVVCGVFSLLTYQATDYGTLAIPLAMIGLLARRGRLRPGHLITAGGVFWLAQILMFDFALGYDRLLLALLPLPFLACYFFRPRTMPLNLPVFMRFPLQLGGRRTLEIYVIHILVFQLATTALFW